MDPEDSILIERFVRRREQTAFRELYRRNTPRLYALAMRLSGHSRPDAEDLVQEAWIRGVEQIDRFERRSAFSTWLCGILVNCYREQARREAKAALVDQATLERMASTATTTPVPDRSRAEIVDVERALSRLADGFREVVILCDVNGFSHREVAAMLGISVGTSKSQLARGRARLRELLSQAPERGPSSTESGEGHPP